MPRGQGWCPILATLLLCGCGELNIEDGRLPCSSVGTCPAPYSCQAGKCWRHADANAEGGEDGAPADGGAGNAAEDAGDSARDIAPVSLDAQDEAPGQSDAKDGTSEFATDALGADVQPMSDAGVDAPHGSDGPAKAFGSTCSSDDECRMIGPEFFCLKVFQELQIPGGICTRACDAISSTDCTSMGATCISESLGLGHDPLTACLPTCKLDVPCRTGFKCQFVYKDNMLVEPSVCAPNPSP